MAYLGTHVMKATSSTMALVSSVLGFDIVELWSEENGSGLHCTYVHADANLRKIYPDLIVGHYPSQKNKVHKHSPMLCNFARESSDKCHWRVLDETASLPPVRTAGFPGLYDDLSAPIKTEMACMVKGETEGVLVFIVGFAIDQITYQPSKLKFLLGLAQAIYVAAFDLDEDDAGGAQDGDGGDETATAELDAKKFLPRTLTTSLSTLNITANEDSSLNLGMGVWAPQLQDVASYLFSAATVERVAHVSAVNAEDASDYCVGSGEPLDFPSSPQPPNLSPSSRIASSGAERTALAPQADSSLGGKKFSSSMGLANLPPTWDPVDAFSYPVVDIPAKCTIPDNLTWESFRDLSHIADGSNSNIYIGKLDREKVVVKIIKADVQLDPIAVHEFDVEHGMLSRISHPNIIQLKGAGRSPRRFIVLEYLGGGSLNSILQEHQSKPGLTQKLFRRPSFTYANLLSKARDMADAFDYLHSKCHTGATIIHRDLKPDNVGFTSSGTLKLFDFGLCTCVRLREQPNIAYEMTGNTGSLRYMAPEVALRKPYTEKVDVYSYGIMVWQMARDRVPFKGMRRDDYMQAVVQTGERPKLDKSWPAGFSALLTACWHRDPQRRPSFAVISAELTKLMQDISPVHWPTQIGGAAKVAAPAPEKERKSTWF